MSVVKIIWPSKYGRQDKINALCYYCETVRIQTLPYVRRGRGGGFAYYHPECAIKCGLIDKNDLLNHVPKVYQKESRKNHAEKEADRKSMKKEILNWSADNARKIEKQEADESLLGFRQF